MPQILNGKWAIERRLGEGGMGTVFLATDLALHRKVAIKTLSPQLCADPQMVARFEHEAKLMSRLDHPNIIPIYAYGEHENVPFIVMKYLEGIDLSGLLAKEGPLSIEQTLRLMRQLCAGLDFVHQHGIVHRDIKPANIFIARSGHATILDLGVARDPASGLTSPKMTIGTPRYMAPEQFLGDVTDHRADLYALGVVLCEVLSGRPAPMQGPLHWVTRRALADKAAERFQSGSELFQALERAARLPPPRLRSASASEAPTIKHVAGPTQCDTRHAHSLMRRLQAPTHRLALGVGAALLMAAGLALGIALGP